MKWRQYPNKAEAAADERHQAGTEMAGQLWDTAGPPGTSGARWAVAGGQFHLVRERRGGLGQWYEVLEETAAHLETARKAARP